MQCPEVGVERRKTAWGLFWKFLSREAEKKAEWVSVRDPWEPKGLDKEAVGPGTAVRVS